MQKRHIIIKYDVDYDCELIFYDFTFSRFSKTLFRMQVFYLFIYFTYRIHRTTCSMVNIFTLEQLTLYDGQKCFKISILMKFGSG